MPKRKVETYSDVIKEATQFFLDNLGFIRVDDIEKAVKKYAKRIDADKRVIFKKELSDWLSIKIKDTFI